MSDCSLLQQFFFFCSLSLHRKGNSIPCSSSFSFQQWFVFLLTATIFYMWVFRCGCFTTLVSLCGCSKPETFLTVVLKNWEMFETVHLYRWGWVEIRGTYPRVKRKLSLLSLMVSPSSDNPTFANLRITKKKRILPRHPFLSEWR